MCPSLGMVRGGPAVEAPLQTPRELKSASLGWEGQQSWTEAIHDVRRARESPERTDGCLPPWLLRVTHFSSQAPHHSEDSNARSPQEPHRSSWKLSVTAKLPVASFLWVPWAALMARETAHHTYFKHQCNGLWPIEG